MQKILKYAIVTLALSVANALWCEENDSYDDDLLNLSLEKLMEIKITDVTSVSRTKEKLKDTAASIYVLSNEDIKRNGATSIADALRVVPGMQVYKVNSNTWSVSSRGFNYIFSNKLLVLIDGKSVYSPLFSGVNWDIQDYILEDIERIEVVRGPGAVLWGANAVNGVINIITKSAEDTQGDFASYSIDSENMANLQFRHGGIFGDDVAYRLHAKTFESGGTIDENNNSNLDKWNFNKAGLRLDGGKNDTEFNIIIDAYQGYTKPPLKIYNEQEKKFETLTNKARDLTGAYFIGSCKKLFATGSNMTVRGYFDFLENNDYRINQQTTTVDLELQYDIAPINNHHLIWGIGYKLANYKLDNMRHIVVNDCCIDRHLYSGYIQDNITINDKLNCIVSARLEKHDTKNIEIQPNARFSYKLSEQSAMWGTVSRAVKVQSLSEELATSRDVIQLEAEDLYNVFEGVSPVGLMTVAGNPNLKSEKIISYEAGYRNFLKNGFSIVASAFFNQYTDLLAYIDTGENPFGLPIHNAKLRGDNSNQAFSLYRRDVKNNLPIIELITKLDNKLKAKTYGTEITLDWQPLEIWKLQLTYSYFNIKAKADEIGSAGEKLYLDGNINLLETLSANHSVFLLSRLTFGNSWNLDMQLRYHSKIKEANINPRFAFDCRVAKDITNNLKLELVAKDLFYPSHYEFKDNFSGVLPYKIKSSWLLKIKYYN